MPECPTCEKELPTERGVKMHHAQVHDESIAGVERVCEGCGETFNVPPSRSNAKYCSNECRRTRIETNCAWCDGSLYLKKYRIEQSERQFCDAVCRGNWLSEHRSGEASPTWKGRIEQVCPQCGSTNQRRPSRAGRRGFCSLECYGQWQSEHLVGEDNPCWEGGTFPYGKGWHQKKRRAVRIRDQARCQHCGRTEPEHLAQFGTKHVVHHIVPAREIDDPEERNAKENLITLCRGECHQMWEAMAPLRPDVEMV